MPLQLTKKTWLKALELRLPKRKLQWCECLHLSFSNADSKKSLARPKQDVVRSTQKQTNLYNLVLYKLKQNCVQKNLIIQVWCDCAPYLRLVDVAHIIQTSND